MKNAVRIGLVVIMAAMLIIAYYFYLDRQSSRSEAEEAVMLSEVERITEKDLVNDYPMTPREVVKWYNRIITEYYANTHSDEQIHEMASQQRRLLDDELLSYNPEDVFYDNLKRDIDAFAAREQSIRTSKVCSSNDVRYATVNGDEVAYVTAYYFQKEGNDLFKTYQEFCLRKDDEGHWKILTYRLTQGDEDDFN